MKRLSFKTREHALAIQKLWEIGYKISAIKLVREFEECAIVEAKEILQKGFTR